MSDYAELAALLRQRHGGGDAADAIELLTEERNIAIALVETTERERDTAIRERDALAKDAARYQWLRPRVPGSAYRRLGISYGVISQVDDAIDALKDAP